jgi:hypothetical protein
VQKRPNHPPTTTSHASRPPSGYSVSLVGDTVCGSGSASTWGPFSDVSRSTSCLVELVSFESELSVWAMVIDCSGDLNRVREREFIEEEKGYRTASREYFAAKNMF